MTELPSSIARFLVEEIRRARLASGATQEAFGRAANFSPSMVSAVENGTRALSLDYVRGADRALKTGGMYARLVEEFNAATGALSWFREWLTVEREAASLLMYEPALVPGLLQTPDYARTVLRGDETATDEEVEQRVAARIERQAILTGEGAPQVVAVLDGFVLRRPVGGAKVMHAQLTHLVELCERRTVQVQVIPVAAGMYPGVGTAFVLATLRDGPQFVHLDAAVRPHISDSARDIAIVRRKWESLRGEALPRPQSMELIAKVADELWT